jgi:monoamine oxidase
MIPETRPRPSVVVVGAGFTGCYADRILERNLAEATFVRVRVLRQRQRTDATDNRVQRRAYLAFVVVVVAGRWPGRRACR